MRRISLIVILFCAVSIAVSASAFGQAVLGPKDGANLPPADLNRIKVGEAAPDFTLEDQDGKPVTLSKYRGDRSIILVFYRGYW